MKKILVFCLVFILTLSMSSALAAGKLSVEQENFHVISSYSLYGYAYAKVTNVGDKPIVVNTALLEVFNADGDALTSTDYFSDYAKYLQPDEYTYVRIMDEIEDVEASDVDDYMLTITGKADSDYITQRFPCTTSYEPNVKEGYSTSNYMYATFTNDTDETVYGISAVLALLDADGNILYMDDDDLYSERGLTPGSSITLRKAVSSSFIEYFENNGLVPATVDAIVYAYVRQN
jgi:uncharacterized protein YxeA